MLPELQKQERAALSKAPKLCTALRARKHKPSIVTIDVDNRGGGRMLSRSEKKTSQPIGYASHCFGKKYSVGPPSVRSVNSSYSVAVDSSNLLLGEHSKSSPPSLMLPRCASGASMRGSSVDSDMP
jgi:hypothetical protein